MHKIVLLKTHTHANRAYFAGHVIEVDGHTARWLVERGIGKPAEADAASPPQEDAASGMDVVSETKPQRKAKE